MMAKVLAFRRRGRRCENLAAVAAAVASLALQVEAHPELRVNLRSATERLYAMTHGGPEGPASVARFGMALRAA